MAKIVAKAKAANFTSAIHTKSNKMIAKNNFLYPYKKISMNLKTFICRRSYMFFSYKYECADLIRCNLKHSWHEQFTVFH